jgi:PhzF family phenazine biosynthesis protein
MSDASGGTLLRLAAFTTDPSGGNPAGVWIGETLPSEAVMQRVAAEVGYSETVFVAADGSAAGGRFRVRYFSPLAEVPFCGHATIAAGVALAERGLTTASDPGRPGEVVLMTNGGPVVVSVAPVEGGLVMATLASIATWVAEPSPGLVPEVLALLGWDAEDLDPALPPAIGFAGAKHLIIAARRLDRLATLDYPFESLKARMLEADLTTIQLVWREAPDRFRARDPFPVGGVVEDPATGAAAAALGAYLRERGEITAPASFEIAQGVEMGRPSRIIVSIVSGEAGVRVSGNAVAI